MNEERKEPPRGGCVGCLVVLVLVIVGAVFGVNWLFHAPKHQVATSISDFADLCYGRPIPGAAAYTPGPGPHPMAVFDNDNNGSVSFTGEHKGLDPPSDEVGSVQLVACSERVDEGTQVTTCSFDQGTQAPMYASEVRITVYHARTAEQVGEPVTVTGRDSECPTFIFYKGSPELYTTPTPEQFVQVLTPFLTR